MTAERWGALPLGELHSFGTCALCGVEGEERPNGPYVVAGKSALKRTVLAVTRSEAHICLDLIGCMRRQALARAF